MLVDIRSPLELTERSVRKNIREDGMFGKGLRLLLCAAAVFYSLSGQTHAEEPGITQDSITIGAFGPITGPAAYIGLAGRDGANLAIKEINAAGGVNGRKLSMVFED